MTYWMRLALLQQVCQNVGAAAPAGSTGQNHWGCLARSDHGRKRPTPSPPSIVAGLKWLLKQ